MPRNSNDFRQRVFLKNRLRAGASRGVLLINQRKYENTYRSKIITITIVLIFYRR